MSDYEAALEQIRLDLEALNASINATAANVAEIHAMLTKPFDYQPQSLRADGAEEAVGVLENELAKVTAATA